MGSRSMISSGVVEVRARPNALYLMEIENPSMMEPIQFQIEVVAIVKDVQAQEDFDRQQFNNKLNQSLSVITESLEQNKAAKREKQWKEAMAFTKLGNNKMDKGDYDGAISIYKKLVNKKNVFKYYGLNGIANAFTMKKNYEQSLDYHNKTLKAIKKDY